MNKNTLTALLDDLRALILKSRPAYRDFLGEVTEAKTTKILENVVLAESQLMLPVADAAFSGFIAGRAYRVVLNGEEKSVIAKDFNGIVGLSNVEDFSNLPNDAWALRYDSEAGKMIAGTSGAFLGAIISVYYDETVMTQKWSVKKLAYELLPDRLLSALSAAANTARKALTAANAAQSTANAAKTTADAAHTTADNAQTTANTAKTTAENAQFTANAAKTTAENAQSTADTAQAAANSASSQLSKMATKADPVFTGTFSQNRKIGSTSGAYSHAEGSLATASGNCSHAEGNTTVASGSGAHAEGSHTIASGEHSHAQGKFNVEDSQSKYAHIVGNGTNESARSNAHTLDWDGNAWFAGNVYVGGSDQSSGEKLATRNELPKRPVAQLVTLSASEWNADTKTQTITVFGVLADESAQLVTSTPLTTSARAYTNAGIALTGREENMVTFTAETIPTEDIKLYVVRQEIVLLDYLTFSSPEPFSIAVSKPGWDGTMEYFTDATSWTTWAGESISATEKNGKYSLYLRGTGNTVVTGLNGSVWSLTGSNISCTGNIETLLDYITVAAGGHPTMANSCYYNMFSGCTSLIQAPVLPATALANSCYGIMFFSCTSLIQAPALPATTLANSCYNSMFYGCTALTQAPALPATTLANNCYQRMFYGCTSLTQAPELPATTLADGCYYNMFYDCTNLKLSSTRIGEYTQEYRIPSSGEGVTATDALIDMFRFTGGTFKGTPTINTTYYLSSDNMIVREA